MNLPLANFESTSLIGNCCTLLINSSHGKTTPPSVSPSPSGAMQQAHLSIYFVCNIFTLGFVFSQFDVSFGGFVITTTESGRLEGSG